MPVDQFSVTLHHLAPDGRQAGAQYPDVELKEVAPERLRGLIEGFAAVAPRCEYPVAPELRIEGPHGRFLVQVKDGQVRVTSWSAKAGTAELTPERIFAMITGRDVEEVAAPSGGRSVSFGGLSRNTALIVLVLAIVATNGITAWMLTRPPEPVPTSLLPAHTFVDAERARRVFADYAGVYETGAGAGDRSLTIAGDGRLKWIRFGPNRAVAESQELSARAAESRGRPVLVASNFGMIEAKDPLTIVYFGDTYRRKSP